ncbi:Lanosterol 14-alpha-demethylase [Xylographa bjoerkii]|nr:Lanosterol 14-alpha-demethylase [Xylographa bjoerkii]
MEDLNPEDVYNVLTAPVWGSDVVYDVPHGKYMEQKRFIKFGLTSTALRSYVPLIENEIYSYFRQAPVFHGTAGIIDTSKVMAEIVIFTASRSLQGNEVREKLNSTFAENYHDLDMGFTPINFLFPHLPLPRNRKRDIAQKRMAKTYMDIIQARRENPAAEKSEDMIWNLMHCTYKNGSPLPDKEIAHLMTALLMAGQASSAVTSSWIMLHLAAEPALASELYQEQIRVLKSVDAPLDLDSVQKLSLHASVVRETLRLHPPVHAVMRKVKRTIPIDGTDMHVPASNILLAAIGYVGRSAEHFVDPECWDPHRWDMSPYLNDEKRSVKVDYGYGLVSAAATSPYLPFGAGRHRCIGEQFTYLQMVTIVALMVKQFEFQNLEGRKGVVGTDYSVSTSCGVSRTSLISRSRWSHALWARPRFVGRDGLRVLLNNFDLSRGRKATRTVIITVP